MAALPPLEPAPRFGRRGQDVTARATAPPAGSPRRDEKLVQTSGEQTQPARTPSATPKNPAAERRRLAIEPGRPVAKVGDEVITFHDWTVAAKERLQQFPDLKAAYRNPDKAARAEAQKYIVMLGNSTLDMLIDRSLLVQDAKHHINKQKDGAKMLQNIYNEADERFREMEILPCSVNIISIPSTRSPSNSPRKVDHWPRCERIFRQMFLAESYLHNQVRDKIKVELPDQLKYYDVHVKKHEFDRPATITWREIVVEPIKTAPCQGRRARLDGPSDRTRPAKQPAARRPLCWRGCGKAKISPRSRERKRRAAAARNKGGLMETSPGGYGIARGQQGPGIAADRPGQRRDRGARRLSYRQGRESPRRRACDVRGSAGPDQANHRE